MWTYFCPAPDFAKESFTLDLRSLSSKGKVTLNFTSSSYTFPLLSHSNLKKSWLILFACTLLAFDKDFYSPGFRTKHLVGSVKTQEAFSAFGSLNFSLIKIFTSVSFVKTTRTDPFLSLQLSYAIWEPPYMKKEL